MSLSGWEKGRGSFVLIQHKKAAIGGDDISSAVVTLIVETVFTADGHARWTSRPGMGHTRRNGDHCSWWDDEDFVVHLDQRDPF